MKTRNLLLALTVIQKDSVQLSFTYLLLRMRVGLIGCRGFRIGKIRIRSESENRRSVADLEWAVAPPRAVSCRRQCTGKHLQARQSHLSAK